MNLDIADLKTLQIKLVNKVKVSAIPSKFKGIVIDCIYSVHMPLYRYRNRPDIVINAEFKAKVIHKVESALRAKGVNYIQLERITDILHKCELL